ncbi:hypothetical protein [Mycobacterium pinniadriaticum]|uniref:hypothetical protein n=1 Tax=Mycobacterium pinniadriaticum TaxID=2994102 RepID=UPI002B06261E|nr:hypothetical protein [Mycobacterium pinniadriaticum]
MTVGLKLFGLEGLSSLSVGTAGALVDGVVVVVDDGGAGGSAVLHEATNEAMVSRAATAAMRAPTEGELMRFLVQKAVNPPSSEP